MTYFDNTSAFAPSSRRGISEAAITDHYLSKHPEIIAMIRDCHKEVEKLIENYGEVLSSGDIIKAKMLNSFLQEPKKYRDSFMVNVLFESYRVWDESHKNYSKILKLLATYNPEYIGRAVEDHKRKLKICKVPIYKV